MMNKKQFGVLLVAALVLIAILAVTDNSSFVAENKNLSKATFLVS